jgi:ribosomal protein L37AE/L43A
MITSTTCRRAVQGWIRVGERVAVGQTSSRSAHGHAYCQRHVAQDTDGHIWHCRLGAPGPKPSWAAGVHKADGAFHVQRWREHGEGLTSQHTVRYLVEVRRHVDAVEEGEEKEEGNGDDQMQLPDGQHHEEDEERRS